MTAVVVLSIEFAWTEHKTTVVVVLSIECGWTDNLTTIPEVDDDDDDDDDVAKRRRYDFSCDVSFFTLPHLKRIRSHPEVASVRFEQFWTKPTIL